MEERTSQAARLLSILNILGLSREGLTISDLVSQLNTRGFMFSRRTIYRDLQILSEQGITSAESIKVKTGSAKKWKAQFTMNTLEKE